MNINTLIDAITAAVSVDSTTVTWCTTNYTRSHQVFKNADRRDPPGEDECPFVIIYPLSKSVGESQGRKYHQVEVDVCLFDATKTTASNVTSYTGSTNLETFRKHVENAVAGTSMGRCAVDDIEIDFNTVDSFPFQWAGMVFRIGEDVLLGSDPLE